MDTATMLELFGYLGSAIVIVSMLMTSVMKLRVINTIGSLLFSIYAFLIHSYPTMAMNLVLAGINIYHLIRLRNTEHHYDMIELAPDRPVMKYLFGYFTDDIHRYFPGFTPEKASDCIGFLVLCQASPAGVLLARPVGLQQSAPADTANDPVSAARDHSVPTATGASVPTATADSVHTATADSVPTATGDGVPTATGDGVPTTTGVGVPRVLEVVLDYSTPKYRDCSVGKYLYSCLPSFGFRRLIAEGSSEQHIKYLKKMGFRKTDDGHYVLDL